MGKVIEVMRHVNRPGIGYEKARTALTCLEREALDAGAEHQKTTAEPLIAATAFESPVLGRSQGRFESQLAAQITEINRANNR
jgi:hypothetical protein